MKRRGFSLLELVIVIGILAVMAGMIAPVKLNEKQMEIDKTTWSDLERIALATRWYCTEEADTPTIAKLVAGGYMGAMVPMRGNFGMDADADGAVIYLSSVPGDISTVLKDSAGRSFSITVQF